MLTVAKFYVNPDPAQLDKIPLISRTFAKLAIISKEYEGPKPGDGEFWWVNIVNETFRRGSPGQSGVFVVEPIKPVPNNKIVRLIPNLYEYTVAEGVLAIRPKRNLSAPWIFPISLRKKLQKQHNAHAVIVDLTPDDQPPSAVMQTE